MGGSIVVKKIVHIYRDIFTTLPSPHNGVVPKVFYIFFVVCAIKSDNQPDISNFQSAFFTTLVPSHSRT